MLSRNQDFERAVAEFDHVFSRIPLRVCASQDDGRMHIPSSGGSRGPTAEPRMAAPEWLFASHDI
jgi:hypothetical protein